MIAGGTTFQQFVPVRNRKEFIVPSTLLYNSSSFNFVAVISKGMYIWDATDGSFIKCLRDFSAHVITAATTDYPRQRRVFTGDENGDVCLLNYITGTALNSKKVHDGEISATIFDEQVRGTLPFDPRPQTLTSLLRRTTCSSRLATTAESACWRTGTESCTTSARSTTRTLAASRRSPTPSSWASS